MSVLKTCVASSSRELRYRALLATGFEFFASRLGFQGWAELLARGAQNPGCHAGFLLSNLSVFAKIRLFIHRAS